MGTDSPVSMDWSSRTSPPVRRTSAATTRTERKLHHVARHQFGGGDGLPRAVAPDGRIQREPRLQRGKGRLGAALLEQPERGIEDKRTAMTAASTYLPSTSSSTIAASSIHGTGATNLPSSKRTGWTAGVGGRVGTKFDEASPRPAVVGQGAWSASCRGGKFIWRRIRRPGSAWRTSLSRHLRSIATREQAPLRDGEVTRRGQPRRDSDKARQVRHMSS